MAPTTLVVADDHAVVRSGLRMLLDAEPDLTVVDEAGDVGGTLSAVTNRKPGVLLLDLNMPGEPTLPALGRIKQSSPDTRIVILTMHNEPIFAREAMRAGASGFVLKHAADGELVKAIRTVASGGRYVQPELAGDLLGPTRDEAAGELSAREREVLGLLALGHTNPEIAEQLSLSVRTVESHRANIHQKLELSCRADLVRYALEHGLIGER